MRYPTTLFRGGNMRRSMSTLAGIVLLGLAGLAQAQDAQSCGTLVNNYGPFDYRTATAHTLFVVQSIHFSPPIENLTKGGRDNPFGDDLAYTLRVFPNHHRALISLQRLADREKTDAPSNAKLSVACYFERAIRFQPDDQIVRMLFAEYLIKKSRDAEAVSQLEVAIKLAGDNPFTHYNIGLVFLDMKNYERALTQAHLAQELGFTRQELKERLVAAGKWVEPVTSAPKP